MDQLSIKHPSLVTGVQDFAHVLYVNIACWDTGAYTYYFGQIDIKLNMKALFIHIRKLSYWQ